MGNYAWGVFDTGSVNTSIDRVFMLGGCNLKRVA